MILRNIFTSIALAASLVASADVVVFGNDTVVTDSTEISALCLDRILMSMVDSAGNGPDDATVGSTLDYMAGLFNSGFGHNLVIGGKSGGLFAKASVPDGDIPINVSEFSMPATGPVTSPYGPRKKFNRLHRGIDIGIAKGDTICAAFPGTVSMTGYDKRGYGYYVILTHPNGLQTLYAHLDSFLVVPTTNVNAGEAIAIGGTSGNSTGPHLHFETRFKAIPINPASIIDFPRRKVHNATFIFNKEEQTH